MQRNFVEALSRTALHLSSCSVRQIERFIGSSLGNKSGWLGVENPSYGPQGSDPLSPGRGALPKLKPWEKNK